MRNHFAAVLLNKMKHDPRITLLYGDIGNKLFDPIKKDFPKRIINGGVAEANLVTLAAGMASSGLRPFVYTISSFLYLKALEQIKVDVCYPDLPVVLIGTGGGLSYSGLGTTHHSLEDFAVLGSMPNIAIFNPADGTELGASIDQALKNSHPTWIRIGKKGEPGVHSAPLSDTQSGPLNPVLVSGNGINRTAIFATGLPVFECVKASESLTHLGLDIDVWSVPQLKPFPSEYVHERLKLYETVFSVEEHVPMGGLGSQLERLLSGKAAPLLVRIDAGDKFHFSVGEPSEARASIMQTSETITRAVQATTPR